jgi:hypothetical protein
MMPRTVIPCAYLRVFQPLDAFPDAERAHWERYIVTGGPPKPVRPVYRERAEPTARIGLLSAVGGEHADVRTIDGVYHVCPWRTRIRVLASLLTLREQAAPEVAEAFVPEAEARRAARELAKLRRREPGSVPFLLQSPWHVPIRWFVLFDDEERQLAERPDEGWHLSYWTSVPQARTRADRALSALRRSELAFVGDLVADLGRWLASFDDRSGVELDYDGLTHLLGWDDLDNDHSALQIQRAVDALAEGDLGAAAERYQALAGRWAEVRSHESLN